MSETTPLPEEIPHQVQITPAHVLEALAKFKGEVNARFDGLAGDVAEVKDTVKEAGLNGHTPLLKAFLEQYAATYTSRQAWQTVRGDVAHRLRWLVPGKRWVALILAGALGAVGWQLGASALGLHLPQLPPSP